MTSGKPELSVTRLIAAPVETIWQIATDARKNGGAQGPGTMEIVEQPL